MTMNYPIVLLRGSVVLLFGSEVLLKGSVMLLFGSEVLLNDMIFISLQQGVVFSQSEDVTGAH